MMEHLHALMDQNCRMLKIWMLRPIVDLDAINERQATIEQLMHRPDIVKEMRATLRHVKDAPRMLQRLQQTQSCPDITDFKLIMTSTSHVLQLHSTLQEVASAVKLQLTSDSSCLRILGEHGQAFLNLEP